MTFDELMTAWETDQPVKMGDWLGVAAELTSPDDAARFRKTYGDYLDRNMKPEDARGMTGQQVADSNIGYCAGYLTADEMRRMNSLFNVAHPGLWIT